MEIAIRRYAPYNNLHEAEPLRGCACSFAKKACGIFSLVTGAAYLAPRYVFLRSRLNAEQDSRDILEWK